MVHRIGTSRLKILGLASASLFSVMGGAATAQEASTAVEEVVVTGVRGQPRSVVDSPTPVDVFSATQLQQGAPTGMFESIRYLVPSFSLPARAGGGSSTVIATGGLRGLNPDHSLVLVNGKRRHKTALINSVSTLYNGSVGVDLNMIPSAAISRIEVLRDGAAAQYGSDAIAGVLNIILNDRAEGGQISVGGGENFDRNDGEYVTVDVNVGLPLFGRGFANLSYNFMDRGASNRAVPVARSVRLYPALPGGAEDPREASIDRLITTNYGTMPQDSHVFGANLSYEFDNGVELYGFGSYGDRRSILNWTFRPATYITSLPELYPNGVRPRTTIYDEDYEVVGGARGEWNGWSWDASSNYGTNISDWENDSLNGSLGPASPTHFYVGQLRSSEWVNSIDVTRPLELANGGELQASFGAQHRRENYQVRQGELASWVQGTYRRPAGQPSAGVLQPPGAMSTPGFRPEDEADITRTNLSAYVELGWTPVQALFLGGALRYEHFDDAAGDTLIYKVNGRYELTDRLAARASFNTGFRAPSLAQQVYSATTSQNRDVNGDGVAETLRLKNLQVSSPEAIALGATPLTPEFSKNISVGVTATPFRNFTLTIDAYQIKIEDRIAVTTTFSPVDTRLSADGVTTVGRQIQRILVANGLAPDTSGQYYTNAIDTRTRGLDVVATWRMPTETIGDFNFSAGYNRNKTIITGIIDNPPELASLGSIVIFDRAKQSALTDALPGSKVSLNGSWNFGRFSANVRGTRFGGYWTRNATNAAQDNKIESDWIFDVDVGFEVTPKLKFVAGVNNLFNTYPTKTQEPSTDLGSGMYSGLSPFGFTGGSWFVRGVYTW